jgi:hypothetical protein
MCTVTWVHAEGGYELFFNRDELRSRPPEHPPRRWHSQDTAVLAPLDGGGGGTWIAVNEHGLTAALLNHYARENKSPERPRSRGAIPLMAAAHTSVASAVKWASATAMSRFKPFYLVLVDAGGNSALLNWDGDRLTIFNEVRQPVTTSSFCPEAVVRAREEQFRAMVPDDAGATAGQLEAFHRSSNPKGGAWSVRMHRADACTRSMVRIDIGPANVTMRYEIVHPGFTVIDGKARSPVDSTLARAKDTADTKPVGRTG